VKFLYYVLILIGISILLIIPYGLTVRFISDNLPNRDGTVVEFTVLSAFIVLVSGIFFFFALKVRARIRHKRQLKKFESFLTNED
jgi:hypothetical protein